MKQVVLLACLLTPVLAGAQISCPAFGRSQDAANFEFLITWNTADNHSGLAGVQLDEENFSVGGEYKDQHIVPGIVLKYYFDNITALRLKAIYQSRKTEYHDFSQDTLGNMSQIDDVYEQTAVKIAPGFQWHYIIERFSFYGGFEVPVTFYDPLVRTTYALDSSAILMTKSEANIETEVPGGFGVGLGIFGGSTFYYKSVLGIGFELSSAYQYSSFDGTIKTTTSSTSSNGTVITTEEQELSHMRFAPVQASICLSFRF